MVNAISGVDDPAKDRKGWFFRGFRDRYCLGFVKKQFHAVRLTNDSHAIPKGDTPIIVVMNHPSWWDPMICTVLSREFGDREHFGIIDAAMLKKYGFFKWLGFLGVESSLRGAAQFLKTATTLLQGTSRVLWITAQGRFTDVRERPLNLQSGAGHLATKLTDAIVLPIAVEYVFWNEKTPEVLIHIGESLSMRGIQSGRDATAMIEAELTKILDQLNAYAICRDAKRFRTLLGGKVGVGGMYGVWQRIKAWSKLQAYRPGHEE